MNEKIQRYFPDIQLGLTQKEVEKRYEDNLVNNSVEVSTKSKKQIVLSNTFTLFNLLNLALCIAILCVASYKNLLFMGGVICNTFISIIQEMRSKKIIDKLSLLSITKATVIRSGKEKEISIQSIVLDDIIVLKSGMQVPVDTKVIEGFCEVNEAFITGEENPISKREEDIVLSGSFIVSGSILGRVEHVGGDNYTSKITCEAKYIKKANSILMNSLNKVIKWISILVVPLGICLFIKQFYMGYDMRNAVVNTVAAIIGMIPEGLILLTSTVLAVGVIKLSKYKVLVQDLYCIELLARTDVLCLDKTGTLTEGCIEVVKQIDLKMNSTKIKKILSLFASYQTDTNATMDAIKTIYKEEVNEVPLKVIPFTSEKKYSAIITKDFTYILGAPEYILKEKIPLEKAREYAEKYRVLALTCIRGKEEPIPIKNGKACALILMQDVIRKEASNTLSYFKKQGVNIKVISGDNPLTVSNIAERIGIENADKYVDMNQIEDEYIKDIIDLYTIFGRVTPKQKKKLIMALKDKGHTVAMTGDGVNDVLALKEADCSIAMASGSDAARNVSQIVLLDSNFDAMPNVVIEGRQTINNIERSATLFLSKTIYATLLAILFLFIQKPYPYEPIHLTLTSVVTIGIPSFILALENNHKRIKGNFLTNVFSNAFPFAIMNIINIIFIMFICSFFHYSKIETSTLCVMMNTIVSFFLLFRICTPFNKMKSCLFISMILLFVIQTLKFRKFFSLSMFQYKLLLVVSLLTLFTILMLPKLCKMCNSILKKIRGNFISFQ